MSHKNLKSDSNLERILVAGNFALTAELGPPKCADAGAVRKKAGYLKGAVDAVNITDNQTAIVRMSSIGAGTITCNYDGANKHRTIIGNDVFIGSDTQLVAPVEVQDGATIGAGSTITRDAPANELTLSRAPQKTRTGWKRPVKQPKG